eukprot:jgi/Ulvmu1/1141/UM107_0015.1
MRREKRGYELDCMAMAWAWTFQLPPLWAWLMPTMHRHRWCNGSYLVSQTQQQRHFCMHLSTYFGTCSAAHMHWVEHIDEQFRILVNTLRHRQPDCTPARCLVCCLGAAGS